MKILYDHQIFSLQQYGGISRYFYELLKDYSENVNINCDLALQYSDNFYLFDGESPFNFKRIPVDEFFWGLKFKGKAKIHRTLARLGLIYHPSISNKKISVKKINENGYDIFHPTYYDDYFLKYIKGKPFVLTIYDMIHEKYEGVFFKENDLTVKRKKVLAQKAERIIAISENTKKDIMQYYGISEKKINVVYLGHSLNSKIPTKEDDIIQCLSYKYILYVGDRHIYKNFLFFLESISELLLNDNDLYLICAGGKPFNSNELKIMENKQIHRKIIYINVNSDSVLKGLYEKALVFVYPSIYEGFGIPILEAFSCGCPVVLSNSSSFPEVAADAGEYFNPEDKDSIKESIKNVMYDDLRRNELIKKGYKRLQLFSWENTAKETAKVYESII